MNKELDIFYDAEWLENDNADDVMFSDINVFAISSMYNDNDYTVYVDKGDNYICIYRPGDSIIINANNCTYLEYLYIIKNIANLIKRNVSTVKKIIRYLKL